MGVSIRDKNKDGIWWVSVRHAGQRVSEQVGSQEDALLAKQEIESDIRRGKYNIAAVKAARVAMAPKQEEKPAALTLKDYYEKTIRPLWDGSLSRNTYLSYDSSFRVHILPALGEVGLPDLTRDHVKSFVGRLRKKTVATAQKKEVPPKEDPPKKEPPIEEPPAAEKPPEIKEPPPEEGRRLSKETIRKIRAALQAKAKIRRRRVHDTRHTFASLLLSNGESLKYVSARLGHSSIRMTADVYGHLEVGSNHAAMDRLPSLSASKTQAANV